MSADRPAHEIDKIEITPEMICAGVKAFLMYDCRFEIEKTAVRRIYLAMEFEKIGAREAVGRVLSEEES